MSVWVVKCVTLEQSIRDNINTSYLLVFDLHLFLYVVCEQSKYTVYRSGTPRGRWNNCSWTQSSCKFLLFRCLFCKLLITIDFSHILVSSVSNNNCANLWWSAILGRACAWTGTWSPAYPNCWIFTWKVDWCNKLYAWSQGISSIYANFWWLALFSLYSSLASEPISS